MLNNNINNLSRDHSKTRPADILVFGVFLDNSGSDSRNLIGQLQVSKRGRNLERDSKCQWGGDGGF